MGWGNKSLFILSLNHMTNMAIKPLYGENFESLLPRNQMAGDLETWYAALMAQILSSFIQMMTLIDLDLFGHLGYGKKVK